MTVGKNGNKISESNQNIGRFYYNSSEKSTYTTIIDRFVNRIKKTFQYWNSEGSRTVSGRAQAVIPRIDVLIDQLKGIENSSGEHHLFYKYITHPLIREGTKLREEIIASDDLISHQLTSQYILWIDRSYKWVDRFFKLDSHNLNQAVIDNIIKESRERVEKDLHLVSDYIEQQLGILDLSDTLIEELHESIIQQLEPVIDAMKTIEESHPHTKDPDRVKQWRESLHMLRQKFFDQCLEIIDSVIELKTPRKKSRSRNQHLLEALENILTLEDAINELMEESSFDGSGPAKKHIKRKVAALYQQAHKISLDIRLSQELFDRVQGMMTQLATYYDSLYRS